MEILFFSESHGRLHMSFMRKPFCTKSSFDQWKKLRKSYIGLGGNLLLSPGELLGYGFEEQQKTGLALANCYSVLPGRVDKFYKRPVCKNEEDLLGQHLPNTEVICVANWVREAIMTMKLGEKASFKILKRSEESGDEQNNGNGKEDVEAAKEERVEFTLCSVAEQSRLVDCGCKKLSCSFVLADEYFPGENRVKDVQYVNGPCCEDKKFVGCKFCCKCSMSCGIGLATLCYVATQEF